MLGSSQQVLQTFLALFSPVLGELRYFGVGHDRESGAGLGGDSSNAPRASVRIESLAFLRACAGDGVGSESSLGTSSIAIIQDVNIECLIQLKLHLARVQAPGTVVRNQAW